MKPAHCGSASHAFIALGKLCLLDQNLAKESINLLVRELVKADSVAVRSNALLVLSDLCVRYTALVDNHVPVMATCLQAPHMHLLLFVRRLPPLPLYGIDEPPLGSSGKGPWRVRNSLAVKDCAIHDPAPQWDKGASSGALPAVQDASPNNPKEI